MRFGLLGTGYWAAEVHGAALSADPATELVAVWGRDPAKAEALAQRFDARAYTDVDELLVDVDAVAIALPPDVQAPLAETAARAGKHLLLDKPLALTVEDADRVVAAADESGVASVVFFTGRYVPELAAWREEVSGRRWHGARAIWYGSIFQPGNPFGQSPWRKEQGGLWDVGPHALASLVPLLGPVVRVAAAAHGADSAVHLVLHHEGGASSTLATSLDVPPAAALAELAAYGPDGWTSMPQVDLDPVAAFREAVRQLLETAAAGRTDHPCDVRFAREVVAVLADAQRLLDAGAGRPA